MVQDYLSVQLQKYLLACPQELIFVCGACEDGAQRGVSLN